MDDRHLWEAIQSGDLSLLKRLYDKYFYQMCLYTMKSTSDPELVEELVSDCFIRLWENRSRIDIKVSLKHYLFLMLRNGITDHFRHKQLITLSLDKTPDIPDESCFDDQQQYASLYAAIRKLPEQRRKILELAVFDSLTYNEIAEKLGITRNTVKTQIARSYSFLKETLNPEELHLFYLLYRAKNRGEKKIR